jgi:hypothetical protein
MASTQKYGNKLTWSSGPFSVTAQHSPQQLEKAAKTRSRDKFVNEAEQLIRQAA